MKIGSGLQASIKLKTSLITVSLLISVLIVTGFTATISARNGITRVAIRLLAFKANELQKYMANQWNLLIDNQLHTEAVFVNTAQNAIASYAHTLLQSDTEMIFALSDDAETVQTPLLVLGTAAQENTEVLDAVSNIDDIIAEQQGSWIRFSPQYFRRVGQYFFFEPFNWHVFVTDSQKSFMGDANRISLQTLLITVFSVLIGLGLNIVLVGYILRPIGTTVRAMTHVITENDLTAKVAVESRDELGQLAQTFNIMVGELHNAYNQIKNYALHAVYARRNETKVRNIFQKYVPNSVIDSIVERPESALMGANRALTIMFTDIRNFTSISEKYKPQSLVAALNKYFEGLVDIIVEHEGMIDKYIGDAIMAVFGAPVVQKNSALAALDAALSMQTMLESFNKSRNVAGMPPFLTGIGIAHGTVTIGNIGTDKKMDYTVIGNTVNLCARLESLNKYYKLSLLFDQSVCNLVKKQHAYRFIDIVQVRGKTNGEHIYTTQKNISSKEKEAWEIHHQAIDLYYSRKFKKAIAGFQEVKKILRKDYISDIFIARAEQYVKHSPPENWKGVETIQ